MYTGAIPVIVDINQDDFNISYESVCRSISENTKAIIIPHIYGIPSNLKEFKKLGIPIIEDCAQSMGAEVEGKKVGTFGDISIFSFYATKLLTTAKGGAVYSKNDDLMNFIEDLVNFDYRKTYKIRYNYRLSDLQASIGLSQLKKYY